MPPVHPNSNRLTNFFLLFTANILLLTSRVSSVRAFTVRSVSTTTGGGKTACLLATRTMSTSSDHNKQGQTKEYAPSQIVVDEATGDKWRLCVGAAVLNSQNELLVGERLGVPGAWQAPQGGVDDAHSGKPKETIAQAAVRELYEEMGLVEGRDVLLIDQDTEEYRIRYSTGGSDNWLTKAGFAGQELHWVLFRCIDARGDKDASFMVDLSGNGGEDAEFSQAKWQDLTSVIDNIWEKKRGPYEALQKIVKDCNIENDWKEKSCGLDFTGKWSRDNSLCTYVPESLMKRGLSESEAETEAQNPYIQSWSRDGDTSLTWNVKTYKIDGETVRRDLDYSPGEWTESYKGKATLFGDSDVEVKLKRRTMYVAEPEAYPERIAHVTITNGPKGVEESRRYFNEKGHFVLRRTLWKPDDPNKGIVSTEIFKQCS